MHLPRDQPTPVAVSKTCLLYFSSLDKTIHWLKAFLIPTIKKHLSRKRRKKDNTAIFLPRILSQAIHSIPFPLIPQEIWCSSRQSPLLFRTAKRSSKSPSLPHAHPSPSALPLIPPTTHSISSSPRISPQPPNPAGPSPSAPTTPSSTPDPPTRTSS